MDGDARRQSWARAAAEYEKARAIFAAQKAKGVLPPQEAKRLEELSQELARCRSAAAAGYPK
jgi:primosomal protein N''